MKVKGICIIALILFLVLAFCTLLWAAELRRRICSDDAECNNFHETLYSKSIIHACIVVCAVEKEPVTTPFQLIPTVRLHNHVGWQRGWIACGTYVPGRKDYVDANNLPIQTLCPSVGWPEQKGQGAEMIRPRTSARIVKKGSKRACFSFSKLRVRLPPEHLW